jgi:XrtJ-associated TM-motif-TM protein
LKKIRAILPVALFILAASVRVHAQVDGCTDSPENPTAVLGLIVTAAGIGCVKVRQYIRVRNNPKDK